MWLNIALIEGTNLQTCWGGGRQGLQDDGKALLTRHRECCVPGWWLGEHSKQLRTIVLL